MSKFITEKLGKKLIVFGIIVFVLGLLFFLWKDYSFTTSSQIKSDKWGHLGDFFGGVIGSIWALAGVILFYVALREQREDFKNNRNALSKQIEALNLQVQEFELQRVELKETRKVFKIQSETLKKQQFEQTYFSLINLHHSLVGGIDLTSTKRTSQGGKTTEKQTIAVGRDCFRVFYRRLKDEYRRLKDEYCKSKRKFNQKDEISIVQNTFLAFYKNYHSDIDNYLRNFHYLLKFIDFSDIENKEFYVRLLQAQISTYEMLIIFYGGLSEYGDGTKPLIEKYSFFKNIQSNLLLDLNHKSLYLKKAFEEL